MTELHEILYCSVLAPEQPISAIGKILAQARVFNAEHQITGLLVFDGMRFCQHFEGPQAEVRALMDRIARDRRHIEIRVLYDGPLAQRRCDRFDMGYAEPDDPGTLAGLHLFGGQAALERFLALRPHFDINR